MKLVGMLDSPYVRRVAVSLQYLGLQYQHHPVSVFSEFKRFHMYNPVVKAPSLICDDGTVLMESSLILQYAESLVIPELSLMPFSDQEFRHHLSVIGLALAACEKSVQIVYERNLRPPNIIYQPWLERITDQLLAAYKELDEIFNAGLVNLDQPMCQAGITTAVTWNFSMNMIPDIVACGDFNSLSYFSKKAEALPAFSAAPFGTGRACLPS